MENNSESKTEQEKINSIKNKNISSNHQSSLPMIPVPENHVSGNTDGEEETFTNNESKSSNKNKKKKYHIDYASTVEEAYDNLNNIIGSDGIKNLTSDTKKLMHQQMQLTEAMKNIQPLVETMGPLLEKAGGLLNSMGGSDNIGNLANLAKNFTAK